MKEQKQEILDRLSGGESLIKILKDEDMPCCTTVYRWLRDDAEFADGYSKARQIQADMLADMTLEIADDCYPTPGDVGKARLQVQARQWYAGCVRPKSWGPNSGLGVDGSQIIVTISKLDSAKELGEGREDDVINVIPESVNEDKS